MQTADLARTVPLSPTRVPQGPKGVPLLGNILDVQRDAIGNFQRWAQTYGDVVSIRLGQFPALIVTESDLIEQILVKQHEKFIKNRVFWRQLTALLGKGLFTTEGAEWLWHRKLSAPAFATKPLAEYAPHMVEETEKRVAQWQDGQEIDIHHEMMSLGLLIAARTLLNADVTRDLDEIEEGVLWVMDEVAARYARPVLIPDAVPLPGHVRYKRGIARLEKLIYRIIGEHRAGKAEPSGLLAQLMSARDDEGNPMSDVQLRDSICTLLLAGYETSAASISWGFHLLGQHRDIQNAIADEVRAVCGDRAPNADDLKSMPLTERAVIEILRLYPAAWLAGREATEDTRIGDYEIKAGTTILLSPWITQRDPRYFTDPEAFRPERWEGDFRRQLPRFAYFPFGGGPRICIGNRFAMMEAMLLFATIIQRFDVERLTQYKSTPLPSITVRPVGGIRVKLHARG